MEKTATVLQKSYELGMEEEEDDDSEPAIELLELKVINTLSNGMKAAGR